MTKKTLPSKRFPHIIENSIFFFENVNQFHAWWRRHVQSEEKALISRNTFVVMKNHRWIFKLLRWFLSSPFPKKERL